VDVVTVRVEPRYDLVVELVLVSAGLVLVSAGLDDLIDWPVPHVDPELEPVVQLEVNLVMPSPDERRRGHYQERLELVPKFGLDPELRPLALVLSRLVQMSRVELIWPSRQDRVEAPVEQDPVQLVDRVTQLPELDPD
jgi:hypothetical protein